MKVLFMVSGPITFASARMRGYWLMPYMEGAECTEFKEIDRTGRLSLEYDAYVFQKYGRAEAAQVLKERGKEVWWDVCDPLWWWTPNETSEILPHIDGMVFATETLKQSFLEWRGMRDEFPMIVIPDRLEFSHFNKIKEHQDVSPVRCIWFGIGYNRPALAGVWANLVRLDRAGHPVELTVMDDMPHRPLMLGDEIPVTYARWHLQTEVDIIARHDLAILPRFPGPWGALKSNNKNLTASACGVPAVTGVDYDELKRAVTDYQYRRRILLPIGRDEDSAYHVKRTAEDWQRILSHGD